jgi:hypothetical protein
VRVAALRVRFPPPDAIARPAPRRRARPVHFFCNFKRDGSTQTVSRQGFFNVLKEAGHRQGRRVSRQPDASGLLGGDARRVIARLRRIRIMLPPKKNCSQRSISEGSESHEWGESEEQQPQEEAQKRHTPSHSRRAGRVRLIAVAVAVAAAAAAVAVVVK